MKPTLEQFLKSIRRRQRKGKARGIVTADAYLDGVRGALGDERFRKFAKMGSPASWSKAFRESRRKFTYFDPDRQVITGGLRQGKAKDVVVQFGDPKRKDAERQTRGAVMDFECILTSRRKDRDGDVLYPEGAEVDAKMPLLWQHIPVEPLGKLVQVINQDEKAVTCHFSVIDTELGRDAAQLVEFGALRISHGFQPVKFVPLEEGQEGDTPTDMFAGWEIQRYKVMEGSLVSIPSNEDAVITAYSREKLHHPLVKGWADGLYRGRKKVVKGGFAGKPARLKTATAAGVTVNLNLGADANDLLKSIRALLGSKWTSKDDEDAKKEDHEDKDDEEEKEDAPGGTLTDVKELLDQVASMDLPPEAADRLTTVSNMVSRVMERITTHGETVGEALEAQNMSALNEAHAALLDDTAKDIARITEEVERLVTLDGMPEGAAEQLGQARAICDQMVASMVAVEEAAETVDEGEQLEGEDDPAEEQTASDDDELDKEDEEDEEDEDDEGMKDEPEYAETQDDEDEDEDADEEKDALEADDSNDDSMEDPVPEDGKDDDEELDKDDEDEEMKDEEPEDKEDDEEEKPKNCPKRGTPAWRRKRRDRADDLAVKLIALISLGHTPSAGVLANLSEALDEVIDKEMTRVLSR